VSLVNINSILKKISENHANDIKLGPNSRILVVDLLNLFIRAYAANPATNDDGVHIGGITGSLTSLGYVIKRFSPTRVIIVTDGVDSIKKRKEIFEGYKAQRKMRKEADVYNRKFYYSSAEMEEKIMKMELARLFEYLSFLPITTVMVNGYEADDIIWYITTQIFDDTTNHIILSMDKDFLQLCETDNIKVFSPIKKILYDKKNVQDVFGVPAHHISLLRAIDGDNSDNIPGVPRWGIKTILKKIPILLDETVKWNLDNIYEYAVENNIGKFLENFESIIKRNYKLMSLGEIRVEEKDALKIKELVTSTHINQLNKFKIQKMLIEDRATSGIRNPMAWMDDCFSRLNYRATSFNDEIGGKNVK